MNSTASTLLRSAFLALAFSIPFPLCAAEARPVDPLAGVPVRVLARSESRLAGRTVTYVRIAPPNLPREAAPAPEPVVEPTAADLLELARLESKSHETLGLSVTVYPGSPLIAELRWWDQDRRAWRAWSGLDWRLINQLTYFETATACYSFFPMVVVAGPDDTGRPTGITPPLGMADYVVEATAEEMSEHAAMFEALDFLHAYAVVNRTALTADLAAREAAAAEARRNPPPPPPLRDETIYFWKRSDGGM